MASSSLPSEVPEAGGSGLFAAVLGRGPVAAIVGDAAYLEAMLQTEAALARAQARVGLLPAGAWHAEWHPLRELFTAVGSAAAWLADCLMHLEVDPGRMRANIGPDVKKLLDPPDYLASTGDIIAAALRRHTTRRES